MLHTSSNVLKEIKDGTLISKKHFRNKAFKMGSVHLKIKILEKLELKIEIAKSENFKIISIQVMKNCSASKCYLKF